MSETRFEEKNTNGQKLNITRQGMYSFIYDCYWGSRGFVTGDYLFQFTRESGYTERKKQSYYRNYIKGVLNSVINPVFSENARREYTSDIVEAFIENVDRKGTSIQSFTKSSIRYLKSQGVSFIVMDNYSDPSETEQDAIDTRRFPYIYYVTGEAVNDYKLEETVLKWITFLDGKYKDKDGKSRDRYRKWTEIDSYYFIIEDGKEKIVSDVSVHNLGKVPVIVQYAEDTNEFLPIPPYYDICRLNLAIYNQDSEQRSLERTGAFPLLAMQAEAPESAVDIGKDSIIWYSEEANAPSFIEPKKDTFELLRNSARENIDSLVEQANSLGATVISSSSAKSGDAYAMEFLGQNFELQATKVQAETTEDKIIELLGLYMNTEYEYKVIYNDNYKPTLAEVEKLLTMLERILLMDISDAVNAMIKASIIDLISVILEWGDEQTDLLKQGILNINSGV